MKAPATGCESAEITRQDTVNVPCGGLSPPSRPTPTVVDRPSETAWPLSTSAPSGPKTRTPSAATTTGSPNVSDTVAGAVPTTAPATGSVEISTA